MSFLYVKVTHIVFVISWMAGLFYLVRLFIYHREAQDRTEIESDILSRQFSVMENRLLFYITIPAMIISVVSGGWMLVMNPGLFQGWMHAKILLVGLLIAYTVFCLLVMNKLARGQKFWSSKKLRMLNEVPTVLMVGIVGLVVVKQLSAMWWAMGSFLILGIVIFAIIALVKRSKK